MSTPTLTGPPSLPDSLRMAAVDSRIFIDISSMSSGGCAPSSYRNHCPVMVRVLWRTIAWTHVATNWFCEHIASVMSIRSSAPYRALGADGAMWAMCGSRVRRIRL